MSTCPARSTTGPVPAMKPEVTAIGDPQDGSWKITLNLMVAGFAYRNLGILRYGRRHVNDVICDFRPRAASAKPITAQLLCCDWLGRIGLLLTGAVRHLAAQPFGSDRWLHHPRWVGWLVRYLDIYLFYVYEVNSGYWHRLPICRDLRAWC